MHKNIKKMFLLTTIIFLLVGLSTITASEVDNNQTNTEKTTNNLQKNTELSTNTHNQPTTKSIETKNKIIKQNKQQNKQEKPKISTTLTLNFDIDENDPYSTENNLITYKNQEYTLNIKLTEDENDKPLNETIQLYYDNEASEITLNQTGEIKQQFTTNTIGTFLIYAEYEGNETYEAITSDILTLTVIPYPTTITINKTNNPCYNSSITITGTVYNNIGPLANEELIILFNNNIITTEETDIQGNYDYTHNLENIPVQENAKITVYYQPSREEYSENANYIEFDIEKISNTIYINPIQNQQTKNQIPFNIIITDENNKRYNENIKAQITYNNTKIYENNTITGNNGQYQFNFTPNNPGNYTLKITTPENEYYQQSQEEYKFEIYKKDLNIIPDECQSVVNENVTITGIVLDESNTPVPGINIEISTNDTILGSTTTDSEGKFIFTNYIFHEITEDDHIKLYYKVQDENYQANTESTYYLSARNVDISIITNDNIKINGTLNINGRVKDAINQSIIPEGNIKIYINDEEIITTDILNGLYNISYNIGEKYIGLDQLRIESMFIPNNPAYYTNIYSEIALVEHEILETKINITTKDNLQVEENTNITITLQDENNKKLNEPITVQIIKNNTPILTTSITLENGTTNITFTPEEEGIYNIIANYAGKENIYSPNQTEYQITANKIETKITINNITNTAYVNDTIKITGKLTDNNKNNLTNKTINIIINSTNENIQTTVKTNINGTYEYEYIPKQSTTYNITVIFESTTKYETSYTNTSQIIYKHNTSIILQPINPTYKYQSNITIKGKVVEKDSNTPVTGNVTIKINNNTIDIITLTNGEFIKEYTTTQVGENNNLTIIFNENTVYNTTTTTTTFNTEALNTKIIINPINTTIINQTITITGLLLDENNNKINGTIQIKINNNTNNLQVQDGIIQYNHKTNKTGTNTITITYSETTYYHTLTNTTQFSVTRADLEIKNLEKTVNKKDNTITITGQLTNNYNLSTDNIQIKIKINNETYPVTTTNNGTFTITTNKLVPDEYLIQLEINQTEYFNNITQNAGKTIITKSNPKISINQIPETIYSQNITISGKLTDNYLRPLTEQNITITIQGNKYKIKTDNEGNYNLTTNNYQTGTNKITITAEETDYTNKKTIQSQFIAQKDTPTIILENINNIIPGETLTIKGHLQNSANQELSNKTVIIRVNNKVYPVNTDDEGEFTLNITNINMGNYTIQANFEDQNHEKTSTNKTIQVNKLKVNLVVNDIVARVGEYITLRATITDQYNNPVTGGNLVFKLNGRTLRSDGRFDTNTTSVQKFNVINGIVEYTLRADLYLRHGKNISASYSGSYKYENAKSNTAQASIQLRYANITLTATPSTVQHHQNITFKATLNDVTPNSNKNYLNNNTSVLFKINGVTIKDNENRIIRSEVKDNIATLNYNVTSMAGVTTNYNMRDYIVTAVYENPYYYPQNNRNTTTFNVERSIVNINIQQAKVTNNKLNIKAKLTDYLGYNITGKNKICIKINGVTYKEGNESKYYTIQNGVINIDDIDVSDMKVKSLEIVTGDRLAYLSARQLTTEITY